MSGHMLPGGVAVVAAAVSAAAVSSADTLLSRTQRLMPTRNTNAMVADTRPMMPTVLLSCVVP